MEFLDNKYTRCYMRIIQKARSRTEVVEGETHHVLPKSLGGSNNSDNLARLTYREHFVCHLLLLKMTKGTDKIKMQFAVKYMLNGKRQEKYYPSSRMIEIENVLLLRQEEVVAIVKTRSLKLLLR